MKKALFLFPLLLVACKGTPPGSGISLEQRLENPLFAEVYYDVLLDRMVELDIQDDPILKDEDKAEIVEDTRRNALAKAKVANTKQREGMMGNFVPITEETKGEALFVDSTLYFGPTFEANPGPSVHVLLTTVVDPREGTFPDETVIDIGPLESPFGAQAIMVPAMEDASKYRTVVLWDTELERIHGFAQLSK
ncbi:MAG: DM13 domain-containing protein [Patescibacteria group bacterium]